jgi:transposase
VRLISPQFVAPYVKSNKNDRNDAEAICEAVSRPTMRFVPPKSPEQLAIQALHRIRQRLVQSRTRLVNQIRGILAELDVAILVIDRIRQTRSPVTLRPLALIGVKDQAASATQSAQSPRWTTSIVLSVDEGPFLPAQFES